MKDEELNALNQWLAEHVMGFRRRALTKAKREEIELPLDDGATKWCSLRMIENYTTDPAAAMLVLEKCADKIGSVVEIFHGSGSWMVCGKNEAWLASAENLPLAIALFAKQIYSKDKP